MDNKPLVTIGIPFYKDRAYLAFAIQSVINQTYQNWELILVDDGGYDGSLDIAKSYKDERISVISDGQNKGLPSRLNEISDMAKGDFIARMDADDIMAVERIEKQLDYLVHHPDVDVVGCSAMVINEHNAIIRSIDQTSVASMFIHPSIMGKRSWFRAYPYNTRLPKSQDYELWLRSLNKSMSFNMAAPLLFYRELDGLSCKKAIASHKVLRGVYRDYRKYEKTWLWGYSKIVMSYIKDIIYILANIFGLMPTLDKWRWHRELPVDQRLADDDLRKSIAIPA